MTIQNQATKDDVSVLDSILYFTFTLQDVGSQTIDIFLIVSVRRQ